eukprot:TRINITY_DN10697_c0_g2_i2.p1 TRINITY_DN10697_c0_g2~~TRINITY_DN10697_c0_g2_i2.p1  ORF type:complete len:175 (+),score=46.29 TRINITY_DN10697_c0_g2_i2:37-525(+)
MAEWEEQLKPFEDAVASLNDKLDLLKAKPASALREQLSPLESAKFDLLMAYSMNSMFWMYLSSRGINPADHPVKAQLERVRDYMMKIKRLEAEASGEGVRLNKSAADRFIKHAMAGDEDDSTPATKKAKKTKAKADKEKGDKSKTKKKGSKKQKKGKKGQDA